ncbi:hypothetical protein DESC_970032 [Desulfosarcina cetonica]|nr:hypothetical protein DESC_970032 [Desulfosarcina cetonica]
MLGRHGHRADQIDSSTGRRCSGGGKHTAVVRRGYSRRLKGCLDVGPEIFAGILGIGKQGFSKLYGWVRRWNGRGERI